MHFEQSGDFALRVRLNQQKLTSNLRSQYDSIVCGSGSSGSVTARRLAENPDVSELLLAAGGSDFFASESDDTAWNYESVVKIYRRIEDWQVAPDPTRRGTGGLVLVQSAPDPNPIALAMVEGACSIGLATMAV